MRLSFIITSLVIAGCSRGPSRVLPPEINHEQAGREALRLYDADGDDAINEPEAVRCPAMLVQFKTYDRDGDGLITAAEITSRIDTLRQHRVGLSRLQCQVQFNGRALPDASVVLEPEPYLGGEIKQATGTTNANGIATMSIADEDLPSSQRGVRAVHYGSYKVRITHPSIALPGKYNTSTELGYETIIGDPTASFVLKSQ